jgi:hypothetical protein
MRLRAAQDDVADCRRIEGGRFAQYIADRMRGQVLRPSHIE